LSWRQQRESSYRSLVKKQTNKKQTNKNKKKKRKEKKRKENSTMICKISRVSVRKNLHSHRSVVMQINFSQS
jgi:hypothetical protein